MKRLVTLASVMILLALSFALVRPAIASGLYFDYAVGGHSVSIWDEFNNRYVWYENTPNDSAPTSFSFTGRGSVGNGHEPFAGTVNLVALDEASAVSGNASFGTMGVSAKVVDPSGSRHSDLQTATAAVQMGGAFIIAGPVGTVDLKVRTTLDGTIDVTLQPGISSRSIISLEMIAASQAYDSTYFSSSAQWSISSLSGSDEGGNPYDNPGLYLNNDRISATGSYAFSNHELTLILAGVKTNQLFNLDLFLNAAVEGPFSSRGTIGDEVDFFNTYSMGFTSGSDPEQWFELPVGYSIATAPVPEPETWAMLLAGLGLMGWLARQRRSGLP